jgi:hypothetical protein
VHSGAHGSPSAGSLSPHASGPDSDEPGSSDDDEEEEDEDEPGSSDDDDEDDDEVLVDGSPDVEPVEPSITAPPKSGLSSRHPAIATIAAHKEPRARQHLLTDLEW